jgi:hypothetical protein
MQHCHQEEDAARQNQIYSETRFHACALRSPAYMNSTPSPPWCSPMPPTPPGGTAPGACDSAPWRNGRSARPRERMIGTIGRVSTAGRSPEEDRRCVNGLTGWESAEGQPPNPCMPAPIIPHGERAVTLESHRSAGPSGAKGQERGRLYRSLRRVPRPATKTPRRTTAAHRIAGSPGNADILRARHLVPQGPRVQEGRQQVEHDCVVFLLRHIGAPAVLGMSN